MLSELFTISEVQSRKAVLIAHGRFSVPDSPTRKLTGPSGV